MTDLPSLVKDPAPFLTHADADIRRLAISACSGRVTASVAGHLTELLAADPNARVRAEAAEVLSEVGSSALAPLLAATKDPAAVVREAIATGLGELEDSAALPWLLEAAAHDQDKLVREASVAALGAIADEAAVALLLQLVTDGPPQVRRRCVVALSVFEGPQIEAAIRAARDDRNPMVREAAEMVF